MRNLRIFGSKRRRRDRALASNRPRLIFVSHEATRTGAPKIILNLLKQFAEQCDIDCETILHDDGHLIDEFGQHSQVNVLHLPRQRSKELQKKVRSIVKRRNANPPAVAVCNSMESRFVAEQLRDLGVPVVSLVHELPCSYTDSDYQVIYDASSKIVFPAAIVREATHNKRAIPFGKDIILPQGLLDPDFGQDIDPPTARQDIRNELGLPSDAFIVLGCGTLDMRKGIDHFVGIAKSVIEKHPTPNNPIHFVWVGDGPRWPHSAFHYMQIDLRNSQVTGNVHFIGERENVESYFVGADLFLLSSRVDPFPCVIHEAMATQLPVMAFEGSGGAPEALREGGGFVMPYGNYDLAAHAIRNLACNPAIADSMRSKSLLRVQEEYRFDTYAQEIMSLAEGLAEQNFRLPRIYRPESSSDPHQMADSPLRRAA